MKPTLQSLLRWIEKTDYFYTNQYGLAAVYSYKGTIISLSKTLYQALLKAKKEPM
jgi:hypothetical protein